MRTITTQKELDAAGSEWVRVEAGSFEAWGSAHVEARDFVTVTQVSPEEQGTQRRTVR